MAVPTDGSIRTVGDLIARLQEFDADLPVRSAPALDGTDDNYEVIEFVGRLAPSDETIAVFHGGSTADSDELLGPDTSTSN